VKKLLIIQQDEAYFLFETLQVLEKNHNAFKEFELTVLVDEASLKTVCDKTTSFLKGITTDVQVSLASDYDLSVNLSLKETSWDLHARVNAQRKIGILRRDGETIVEDLWSTYLLTLKSRAPYLTFHLQDIYKNILGIRSHHFYDQTRFTPKQFFFGTVSTHLFSAQEQEIFLNDLCKTFPKIPVNDISEIDLLEDVTNCLYIGPATLEALKFCEAGGRGIFLTSAFQGMNLLPHHGEHVLLSSRGFQFKASTLMRFVEAEFKDLPIQDCPYSIYTFDHTVFSGAYLKSHNLSDDNYPFYQSHVVLWNFLLNLCDMDLDIVTCTGSQLSLLKTQYEVLTKFIRLHDYAMTSIDTIHSQAKSHHTEGAVIDNDVKNLLEIEAISDQIAVAHPLLRPFLDFYHIRRGQNFGSTLAEQAQNSLLTYAEEHQALKALQELFSVTLRKNEVNI
jgi:hypothetical protein